MPRKRRPPRPGALSDLAPLRILTKILLLQAAYYASAIILIIFTVLVAGQPLNVDLFLSWRTLRSDTTAGWMLAMIWMLNSLVGVIFILLIVVRSKLVTDFALTIHFIQLVVTTVWTRSLPVSLFWWSLQGCSALLMTFLGIWACQWRELRSTTFGFGSSNANGNATTAESYELVEQNETV